MTSAKVEVAAANGVVFTGLDIGRPNNSNGAVK